MAQKYSDEITKLIIDTVFKYCDRIATASYFNTYKLCKGGEFDKSMYNNILYTIGSGDEIYAYDSLYKLEDEILVAVCANDGREGMVFALNGIYYRKDSRFCQSSYTEYKDCTSINSIFGLDTDKKFSKTVLEEMFEAFSNVFKISSNLSQLVGLKFFDKLRTHPDYFGEGKDEIDKITKEWESFYAAKYNEQLNNLSIFKIKEKKKISEESRNHFSKIENMAKARNSAGSFDEQKHSAIITAIQYALHERYFLDSSFKNQYISMSSQEEMKQKAIAMASRCDSELDKDLIEYGDDEFVACVDLSQGKCLQGFIFKTECMLYVGLNGSSHTVYYDLTGCYDTVFYKKELNDKKVDVYKLNYVLDKLHKITEGKL